MAVEALNTPTSCVACGRMAAECADPDTAGHCSGTALFLASDNEAMHICAYCARAAARAWAIKAGWHTLVKTEA